MRRFVLALALLASGPALAGELELTDAEVRAGIPYAGEHVLQEGETRDYMFYRGDRSYLNPEYADDWKRQICVLDFLRHQVIAADKRGDIEGSENQKIQRILRRDRRGLREANEDGYMKNYKFFHAVRRGFGDAGIEYCNG